MIKFIHKNTGTLSSSEPFSEGGFVAVWMAAHTSVFPCKHLWNGLHNLQCLQGTRLKKTKFITLPLLIKPTVNTEWEN